MARLTPEKRYEQDFCRWCSAQDMKALKGPTANSGGFPDRFVQLKNGGGTVYVEFKGTSDYYGLSERQLWWCDYLKASNPHRYFVVSDQETLERLKRACLVFMEIGPDNVKQEHELLLQAIEKRKLQK